MAVGKRKKARATTAAHDEKRLEIIEHCAELFGEVGYHGTTMQMLADKVGLGKPTLYHYFASKTDILFDMHQISIDALIDGLDHDAAKFTDPGVLLTQACANTLRQIAEHPGFVRAFMEHHAELEGKQRNEMRQRRLEYFERIIAIIENGVAGGQFRKCDARITALGFVGMCNWAYKWYPAMSDKYAPERMAKTLCQVFLEGLNRPK